MFSNRSAMFLVEVAAVTDVVRECSCVSLLDAAVALRGLLRVWNRETVNLSSVRSILEPEKSAVGEL